MPLSAGLAGLAAKADPKLSRKACLAGQLQGHVRQYSDHPSLFPYPPPPAYLSIDCSWQESQPELMLAKLVRPHLSDLQVGASEGLFCSQDSLPSSRETHCQGLSNGSCRSSRQPAATGRRVERVGPAVSRKVHAVMCDVDGTRKL